MASFSSLARARVRKNPRSFVVLFIASLVLTTACSENFVTATPEEDSSDSGGGAGGSSDGGTTSTGSVPGSGGDAASGGNPGVLEIPTEGLTLWLKADAGVETTDEKVTAWRDQSTNGNDATTSSLVAPLLGSAKFGATSRPVVNFDGTTQYLALPNGFSSFDGLSLFVVAVPKTLSLCESFLSLSNGDDLDDVTLGYLNTLPIFEVADENVQASADDAISAGTPVLISGHQSGEIGIVATNGEVSSQNTIHTAQNLERAENYLGKTTYSSCQNYSGALAEVVVYSRTLDELEYATVVAYLKSRYSIN